VTEIRTLTKIESNILAAWMNFNNTSERIIIIISDKCFINMTTKEAKLLANVMVFAK
jgi:hypothetical protein